jgi:GTP cyclohydrolase-4
MGQQLPDVQKAQSDVTVGLNRVGFTDVEKLVKLGREGDRPIVLMANFEVFIDLPSWRKGADMSRNMEVIDETLESVVAEPAYRVEDVCGNAAERLLEKHDYTTEATVKMDAEFITHERTPASENKTQQTATIIAGACVTEEGTTEEIGARVTGMTVCPCSQGMSKARARETLRDLDVEDDTIDQFFDRVPQAGHSQRGHATLSVESDGAPEVDFTDLIDVARDAMSARISNLAKRPDEDHMTEAAHENAKFVEDCVRDMAKGMVREFPDLADSAVVTMKQSNDESIHQHNAHAERVAQVGQLREELGGAGVPADD